MSAPPEVAVPSGQHWQKGAAAVGRATVAAVLVLPLALAAASDSASLVSIIVVASAVSVVLGTRTAHASAIAIALALGAAISGLALSVRFGQEWKTQFCFAISFVFGFVAPLRLFVGVVGGVLAAIAAMVLTGGVPAVVAGLFWAVGLGIGELAPRLSGALTYPLRPLSRNSVRQTTVFLFGFFLTAVYFGIVYWWAGAHLPGAFKSQPDGLNLLDYVALSLVILAAGEPTALEPAHSITRAIFAMEVVAGLLWIAFYLSILVARLVDDRRSP